MKIFGAVHLDAELKIYTARTTFDLDVLYFIHKQTPRYEVYYFLDDLKVAT
jgi:hypothetical protein